MSFFDDFGFDENMTKEQVSEKLFNARKKLITRQNSADIQKRSQAELQLDILSGMQNAIDKMTEAFDVQILVETYVFAVDNGKLNKDLRDAIENAVSGSGDAAGKIANYLGNNGQFKLRNNWMLWAANCGDVNAFQICGYLLADTSPDEAVRWFEKADEANTISTTNVYNWGLILYRKKEFEEALSKFERASKEGHANASFMIAEMYENGYGVNKDLIKALEQYKLAKQGGLKEAQQGITRIATVLNQQNTANIDSGKQNYIKMDTNTTCFQQTRTAQNGQTIDNRNVHGSNVSYMSGNCIKDIEKKSRKKHIIGIGIIVVILFLKSCVPSFFSIKKELDDALKKSQNIEDSMEDVYQGERVIVVEEGIGTKLSKTNITESNRFDFTEKNVIDTVGFLYSGNNIGILSASSDDDGYVRFDVGENDKYLQGLVSVSDETNSIRNGKLQILTGRGGTMNLVYESDTLSRITGPFLVSVDVENAETTEIRFIQTDNNGYSYKEYIILADFRLYEESQEVKLPTKEYADGQKLSDFKVSLSSNYYTSVENPKDTIGNNYDVSNLTMLSMDSYDDGYACYYVDDHYKYISGIFAPQADSNLIRSGIFIVYAYMDDEWVEVYESDTITRTSKAEVFSADISGATWIEVVYRHTDNNGYSYDGNLLLSEVAFYKNELPNLEVSSSTGSDILPLSQLNVVQSEGFNFASEKQYDTVGNTYMGSNVANITSSGYDNGYVNYYLGGNYKYLAGVVSLNDETSNIREGILQVSTKKDDDDWKVIYESQTISRVTSPFELVADVDNAEWMRIEFVNTDKNGYSYKSYAILDNMTLYANDNYEVHVPKVEYKDSCLLSDLKIAECEGYVEANESQQDFAGNKYMGKNIESIQSDGYAYYFVDGNYSTISGKIVPRNDSNEIRTCHFMIYKKTEGDDWKLAYESGDITNSTEIIDYEVDITGADWICLEYRKVDKKGYSYKAYGILSGIELK